ncbi:MAG TPA: serine hydrolase domain-containing protein, partial [Acidobacteriota bacterium]
MTKTKTLIILLLALWFGASCRDSGLDRGKAAELGLSPEQMKRVGDIVQEAVQSGDIPGAVVVVGRKGKVALKRAFGSSQLVPQREPMTEDMIFDLASLTKPLATATSVMILVEQGRLSLNEKVKSYLPEFEPYADETGQPG